MALGPWSIAQQATPQVERTWVLSWDDDSLTDVLVQMHQVTGKTILFTEAVSNKRITAYNKNPMTAKEAYGFFLAVLEINDLTAVEKKGQVKIVPLQEAKQRALPVGGNDRESDNARAAELRTERLPLIYVNAPDLVPVLRPLLAQEHYLAAAPDNSLLITTTAAKMLEIKSIIAQLEVRTGVTLPGR